jgi:hypothetical protein
VPRRDFLAVSSKKGPEEPPGRPHEGPAVTVLDVAGLLTDKHQAALGAFAEGGLRALSQSG